MTAAIFASIRRLQYRRISPTGYQANENEKYPKISQYACYPPARPKPRPRCTFSDGLTRQITQIACLLQLDLDKLVRLQIEYKAPCFCTQLFSKVRRVSKKLQVTSNTFLKAKIIFVSVNFLFCLFKQRLTFAHYAYQNSKCQCLFPKLSYWYSPSYFLESSAT